MLLTIPNSALDSLCPTTEQFESTQVEVSLNRKSSKHSIVVLSQDAAVESVVSIVPTSLRSANWSKSLLFSSSPRSFSSPQLLSPRRVQRHRHQQHDDCRQEDDDDQRYGTRTRSRRADMERQKSLDRRQNTSRSNDRGRSRRRQAANLAPALLRRTVLVRPAVVRTSPAAKKALCDVSSTSSARLTKSDDNKTLAKATGSFDWGGSRRSKSFKPDLVQKSLLATALGHKKISKKIAPVVI